MNDIDNEIRLPWSIIMGVHGRLGARVYYVRNGKQCARRHVRPANPRTREQQDHRARFAAAIRAWRALDDEARARWNRRAAVKNRTGYTFFISHFMAKQADVPPGIRQPVISSRRPRRTVRAVRCRTAEGNHAREHWRSWSPAACKVNTLLTPCTSPLRGACGPWRVVPTSRAGPALVMR